MVCATASREGGAGASSIQANAGRRQGRIAEGSRASSALFPSAVKAATREPSDSPFLQALTSSGRQALGRAAPGTGELRRERERSDPDPVRRDHDDAAGLESLLELRQVCLEERCLIVGSTLAAMPEEDDRRPGFLPRSEERLRSRCRRRRRRDPHRPLGRRLRRPGRLACRARGRAWRRARGARAPGR